MPKKWMWWLAVILFGIAFYKFTASPLSNNEHTLLLLRKLNFLSAKDLILLSKIIRKAAHLLAYACMAVAIRNAMYPHPWTYPAAWFLATLYGASDEFHQLYVIGRTPLVSDVIIDSLGALAGLLIIYWVKRIGWEKQRKQDRFSRFQNNRW